MQVLQGLEIATVCVEDMDEWLGIFNVKLRHMREDIESVSLVDNFMFLGEYRNIMLHPDNVGTMKLCS